MIRSVLILHNAVAENASAADRDVLVQVEAVEAACRKLGHATRRLACTLDLSRIERAIADERPDVAFNLVESLGGTDRLASLVPALLEAKGLPFTGSGRIALDTTNDKPRAKAQLRAHALPTPAWATLADRGHCPAPPLPCIVKAVWEHASLGLDDRSILSEGKGEDVWQAVGRCEERLKTACFAEQYVDGREFNLSLLAGPDGPQVLPPAEIDFSDFPAGKPRIVGHAAKWDEQSFEFVNTPRRFTFPPSDGSLLRQLETLALRCWQVFNLGGYARVDFRVDSAGQPWILEINTNPCLSPDAGFAAALQKTRIDFAAAVERILDDALRPRHSVPSQPAQLTSTAARGSSIKFRSEVRPSDASAVRKIVTDTEKFRPAEIDVAVELVEERLAKGEASGYQFVFADSASGVAGYACFGLNPVTVASYDLYWIAVDPRHQGTGLGKALLAAAEEAIRALEGQRIYIDTSGRPDYWPTRAFYEACGYQLEAVIADFYAPGDDKVLYGKALRP